MPPNNPSIHARVAADALARLVADVRSGRAAFSHPHTARQTTDDLIRLCDQLATAVHLLPAASAPPGRPYPGGARQPLDALGQASRAATDTAQQLRYARRHM